MKTSHLISTINHATSPFYDQKYMKIEQVVLKYLYFAWLVDLRPLVKYPVSYHGTNNTLTNLSSEIGLCMYISQIIACPNTSWIFGNKSGRSAYKTLILSLSIVLTD